MMFRVGSRPFNEYFFVDLRSPHWPSLRRIVHSATSWARNQRACRFQGWEIWTEISPCLRHQHQSTALRHCIGKHVGLQGMGAIRHLCLGNHLSIQIQPQFPVAQSISAIHRILFDRMDRGQARNASLCRCAAVFVIE